MQPRSGWLLELGKYLKCLLKSFCLFCHWLSEYWDICFQHCLSFWSLHCGCLPCTLRNLHFFFYSGVSIDIREIISENYFSSFGSLMVSSELHCVPYGCHLIAQSLSSLGSLQHIWHSPLVHLSPVLTYK